MSDLVSVVADGEVVTAGHPVFVHSVVLTPAAAVATLVLKTNGSSGTTKLTLQAAANGNSVSWTSADHGGTSFPLGVYADIGGDGAAASIELTPLT